MNYLPPRYCKTPRNNFLKIFRKNLPPVQLVTKEHPAVSAANADKSVKFRVTHSHRLRDLSQSVSNRYSPPSAWNITNKSINNLTTHSQDP